MAVPVNTATQGIPFLTGFPGSVSTPSRSPLYVDGIPITGVQPPVSSAQQAPSGQRFWSSEPRRFGDQTNEMMIVTLSSAQLINYISLDLPHFPHQASLAYRGADGSWNWIRGPNGQVLQFIISGSVPSQVNNAAALTAGLNPYHYGANHWIHYDEMIQPVTCGALLVAGTRALATVISIAPGQLPVDASGQSCPYPLGCRNLDFGYRVLRRSDIPYTLRSPAQPTERQPFATADDINGSTVQLTLRENRASDLLGGLLWQCAPQPASSAVVNLYADARDGSGRAQVIDRFYVTPTTSGVSLNLYYTTTPPPSGWQASDTPLGGTVVTVTGSIPPQPDTEGVTFANSPCQLGLGCAGTGIFFGAPWWHAWEIQPQFPGTDPGTYMICDTGILQLWFSAGTWFFSRGSGTVIAQWAASHAVNQRLQFAAGWDGSQLCCWSQQGTSLFTIPAATLPLTSALSFGAPQSPGWSALNGNFRLTSFILKQEAPLFDPVFGGIPLQFLQWALGPQAYVAPPAGPGPTTVNACARFDLSLILGPFQNGLAPYGFAGGVDNAWAGATWTPVQLDYQLTAGYIQFPPVTACGFKFEFTNLAPRPFDYLQPLPQTANVFPANAPSSAAPQPPRASASQSSVSAIQGGANNPVGVLTAPPSADAGLVVNQSTAPLNTFLDAPNPQTPPNQGASLPTEALFATDLQAAELMAARGGSLFNFQQWQHAPQSGPKQVLTAQSSYQQVTVQQQSRIAYFVGISQLAMYRVDYTATSDTAEYIDTFGDTVGISAAALSAPVNGTIIPWSWSPGMLSVPVNLPPGAVAQVGSPTYYSAHNVTAIQFASVQSGPTQLLPDPGFANTALPFVTNAGDALPLTESPATSSPAGALVVVTRHPGIVFWSQMMVSYVTWAAFTSPTLSWLQLEGNPMTVPFGGIAYTGAPVTVTAAGVVYIAARVFASTALSAPLFLQLLDGATGAVVAEEPITVSGGTVTEWSAAYVLGQPQAPSTLTWSGVMSAYPTWSSTSGQTWTQVDTFVPPLGNTLSWQIIQYGITQDVWGVDNVSIFEDSIVWQFSNDAGLHWYPAYGINGNPSGAVVFPLPQPGFGTQLQWRVLGYRPGLTVTSLAIRPWYTIYPRGVPPRVSGIPHGPNVSGHDYYTTIDKDPYWQVWSNPIPQGWFYAYQQLLRQNTTYKQLPAIPPGQPNIVLGRGLVVPIAEIPIGPATFTDAYSDNYGFYYGIVDSSDVYTDQFGNDVYNNDYGYNP